jgi:hypothetical protein
MLERRDLLQHEGGADSDRKLAHALQHPAATFSSWLSAASAAHLCATSTTARRDVKHALASQLAWFKKSVRPRAGNIAGKFVIPSSVATRYQKL